MFECKNSPRITVRLELFVQLLVRKKKERKNFYERVIRKKGKKVSNPPPSINREDLVIFGNAFQMNAKRGYRSILSRIRIRQTCNRCPGLISPGCRAINRVFATRRETTRSPLTAAPFKITSGRERLHAREIVSAKHRSCYIRPRRKTTPAPE